MNEDAIPDDDENANLEEQKIKVYLKDFYRPSNVGFIFRNVIPQLKHENDGIVFTKNKCPIYPGTCDEIKKWKPQTINTVDFQMQLITSAHTTQGSIITVWGLYAWTFQQPESLFSCLFFENEA